MSENINLAALWIPVLPDTSKIGDGMKDAGAKAKVAFEQGFNSAGSSPQQLGQSYVSTFQETLRKGFSEVEIPFGISKFDEWTRQFAGEVDEKLVRKLKGEATQALQAYSAEQQKLTEVQERAAQTEQKLNTARDNGFNKASIMIPLMQEHAAAQRELAEQTTRTADAHDKLTTATGRVNDELGKAATNSQFFAGVMGGAVVAGTGLALKGVEDFVDFIKEGFEDAIDTTKELAEQTIELGEKYELIATGIRSYSSASGEEFEKLEESARKVFGQLDVAGENTGQTMAQFSSILKLPKEELESLTKHVEELQGRFSSLKADDLAAVFYAFKTPAEETDSTLASLALTARDAGRNIGELVAAMKGNAAETLSAAGLNAKQAGAFIAEMMKRGQGGREVMGGLQTAMKAFVSEGISFQDGLKITGQQLEDFKKKGDELGAEDLSEKLFGTRRWAAARDAAQDYLDIVNKGPDAFDQSTNSLDQFITDTETLENKWEKVKHKVEEALMPLGLGSLDVMDTLIQSVSQSFDTNLPEIKAKVKQIGDSFLENLPTIRDFVVGAIGVMGPLFDFIKEGALMFAGTLGGLVGIYAKVTGDDELTKSMEKFGEAQKKIQNIDFTKISDDTTKLINNVNLPIEEMKKKFDAMWDSARGEGADQNSPGAPLPDMTPQIRPVPGMNLAASLPGVNKFDNGTETDLFGVPGGDGRSSMAGLDPNNPVGAQGVTKQQIAQMIYNTVLASGYSQNTALTAVAAAQFESSTNPDITNASGHHGLFQESRDKPSGTIEQQLAWFVGALAAAGGPKAVNADPANVIADHVEVGGYSGSKYDIGGARTLLGMTNNSATSGNGDGPGDGPYADPTNMINQNGGLNLNTVAVAAQKFANDCIDASSRIILSHSGINMTEEQLEGVIAPGTNINVLAAGLNRLDPQGNFQAIAGSGGSQQAMFAAIKQSIDKGVGSILNVAPGSSLAGHTFAPGHFIAATGYNGDGTINLSDTAHGTKYTVSEADAFQATVGRGIVAGYGSGPHAVNGPASALWNGSGDGFDPAGATPGGRNGYAYQGLPGQYGGYGQYGGETADQIFSTQQAVQEARDQAANQDWDIQQKQKRITELNQQMSQLDSGASDKLGPNGIPLIKTAQQEAEDAKKKQSLQDELDTATHELSVAQRERAEQDGKIANAERKEVEAGFKKPTGTAGSEQAKLGQTLGSGLLAGLGQELGIGDVLGKSPLDWGIVKLAEGLFNYGNALGDGIFGKSNHGGLGGPGSAQGLGGGLAEGVLGSLGVKLPGIGNVSAGPNVIPGAGTPASGIGFGPPPGPDQPQVVNDNSIHISPNVDPSAVLPPVINMQRDQSASQNAASYTNTGGFQAR